jgi:HPt (histidine-containing phosphotransfer) domain-containing protein
MAAHALKGSAANLFASRAAEAAAKLEEMGRNGSLTGAENTCATLEKEIERLKLELRVFEKESARSEA